MGTYECFGFSKVFDAADDRDGLAFLDGVLEIRAELLRFGLVVRSK